MATVSNTITPAEYWNRERFADHKSEYYRGEVFAMAGGSPEHSLIAANFIGESREQLKGRPCVPYTSDLRIKVQATGLYTYPDALIVCGELEYDTEVRDTVLNPTVIVEVLSDSTEKYDRGKKASHYRRIGSLQELIFISQDQPLVERFARQSSDKWLLDEVSSLESSLRLDSVDIQISLAEIYRNVKFLPPAREPK